MNYKKMLDIAIDCKVDRLKRLCDLLEDAQDQQLRNLFKEEIKSILLEIEELIL